VFVYTLWLKRTSSQNIVIGGAAGAMPVLIGWSSVTNSLSWAAVIGFGIIFFWTPPHFWALAIRYKDDYAAADVPMLPSVASFAHTADRIVGYTVIVVALSLAFGASAGLGLIYWISAVVLGVGFLALGVKLRRSGDPALAMRLFTWSISYVTLLFAAMAADVLVRGIG
jgi:protoheme IX farnesyltransferase